MKSTYYFFILIALCLQTLHAQPNHPEEAAVLEAVYAYINGRNGGNATLLNRAFYKGADLRYIKENELQIWTAENYISKTQPGRKLDCTARVIAVDIMGNAAQAKVEIEYATATYVDYLLLLRHDHQWRIATKSFAKIPHPEKRVLFVLTSHEQLGTTERPTGIHLGEVSHVYKPLHEAGFAIDFVSPQGGSTYCYGVDLNDPATNWLIRNSSAYYQLTHAKTPEQIDPTRYAAVYYVGGHGTMWDLPQNETLQHITQVIYENNGVVAAVCHGPSGLVNVTLSNGEYLVNGKELTSFTDSEEQATQQDKHVPFLLESTLRQRGARFSGADNWQEHVVVDGRLITGQNPASAHKLALQLIQLLQTQH